MRTNPIAYPDVGRVTVCTTATRPTGTRRYEGKVVFESDTGKLMVYHSGEWGPVSAGGYVSATSATSTSWSTTSTTESALTATAGSAPLINIALSTNRRYKLCFNARFATTVANDTMIARFYENGTQRKGGTLHLPVTTHAATMHHEWVFVPASSSAVNYEVRAARQSGSGTISMAASASSPADFWIEDLGWVT